MYECSMVAKITRRIHLMDLMYLLRPVGFYNLKISMFCD